MRYLIYLMCSMLLGCGVSYDCTCHCQNISTGISFDVVEDGICAQNSIDAGNAVPDNVCGQGAVSVGSSCMPNGDGICFNPVRLAPMAPVPDLTVPSR